MVHFNNDWDEILAGEFDQEYYKHIRYFLKQEYAEQTVYPPMEYIFNALRLTPYSSVKAVILGQDPYHGPGQAHGLCFSVQPGVKVPPSLQNIYKELKSDLGIELCSRKQGEKYYFTPETVKNARNFVRFLMKKYDIPLANVVRHYDVTHKNCPAPFVEDAAAWQSFKAGLIQLTREENMTEKQVKQLIAQAKTVYDTAESVPKWGRGTVDKLLSGDLLRGTDGKLALSEEMLRVLVVLDRAGAFDR